MTLDEHATAARRDPVNGFPAFVAALRADPDLLTAARDRLDHYNAMSGPSPSRIDACWISRMTKTTLLAALEAADKAPDVPAGETNV